MRLGLNRQAAVAGRAAHLGVALVLVFAGAVLSGCGGTNKPFSTQTSLPDEELPSIGDRFSQLFGKKSQAVGEAAPASPAGSAPCSLSP